MAAAASRGGTTSRPVRVVLVDDVADIRLLLRLTLEDDPRFEIVGEAADGREAVERAAEVMPDVVLLDLMMPVMSGLDAIPLILTRSPSTKVIAYSGSQKEVGQAAMALGAVCFLEKGAPAERIVEAILNAAAG